MLTTLLMGAIGGCAEPEPTPEDAATQFLAHVRDRHPTQIWGLLSDASRADLSARYQALQAAQGAAPSKSAPTPAEVLAPFGLTTLGAAKNPVIASPLGDHVVVRVAGPRGSVDLHLVREGGVWKVDLMRSLAPTATSTGAATPPPAPPE